MYNELSTDYDRFVNWENRLAIELPFITRQLQEINAQSILDAGTGTGMHAIMLSKQGYQVCGADNSQGMVEKARQNAAMENYKARFEVSPFGGLAQVFGSHVFDAVLVLGNSLPHLLSSIELESALRDLAKCLHPGGLLLLQNRNFDSVMSNHERWMEPQSHTEGDTEWIFQRFYDFDPDGLLTFNMVTLKRVGNGNWTQRVLSSRLRPILQSDLLFALAAAGFGKHTSYGNMAGDPFNPVNSGNLVVTSILQSD